MAEESIIIDVKVDVEKVQQNLSETIRALSLLKEEQKMLRKQIEAGNDTHGEMAKRLAEVNKQIDMSNRSIRSNTAILQSENMQLLDTNASLNDQRQQLKQLQALYGTLSGEAKQMADAEGGLADKIKEFTEQVKAQESAIGDNRRNVGNYTESLAKWSDAANITKGALEGLAGGSTKASKAADSLNKITVAFSKNPVVGTLAVIVTAIGFLAEKLRENEEQMAKLNIATASVASVFKVFEPIITKVANLLGDALLKSLDWVTAAIEKMLKGLDKIGKWFGKNWNLAETFVATSNAAKTAADNTEDLTDKLKAAAEAAKKLREERINAWAAEEERQRVEREALEHLNSAEFSAIETAKRLQDEQQKALEQMQQLMEWVQEDEEEGEDVPTVEEMVRQRFGLDQEGVDYFKSLIKQGVSAQQAGSIALMKQNAETIKNYATMASALGTLLGAVGDSIVELTGQSEESVKAQKVFGLASIIINEAVSAANTAAAITEAVEAATKAAAATGVAAPFTQPVFVATMVSTIAAAVAGTISSIVQAKQLLSTAPTDAGKFAQGGIVGGSSYTGDALIAHVNSREAIITPEQQKNFLDLANGRTPAFDYDALADVLVAAVAAQPAPIVDYEEFTNFGKKVVTYDEYARV